MKKVPNLRRIFFLSSLIFSLLLAIYSPQESSTTPITTVTTTFTTTVKPSQPPQPEPNYVWSDSSSTFYYITYEGKAYPVGIIIGAYLPQEIKPNENTTLYFYTTRIFNLPASFFAGGAPLGPGFCIGPSYFPLERRLYLHIGVSFFFEFDRWMWHIPIAYFGARIFLSITYPNMSYPNLEAIPYGQWDGPYEAHVIVTVIAHSIEYVNSTIFTPSAYVKVTPDKSTYTLGETMGLAGEGMFNVPPWITTTWLNWPANVRIKDTSGEIVYNTIVSVYPPQPTTTFTKAYKIPTNAKTGVYTIEAQMIPPHPHWIIEEKAVIDEKTTSTITTITETGTWLVAFYSTEVTVIDEFPIPQALLGITLILSLLALKKVTRKRRSEIEWSSNGGTRYLKSRSL